MQIWRCNAMMQILQLAKLFSMRDNVDPTGAAPTPSHGFSHDVEEEANSYFQKVYTSNQSVDEFIAIIKSFRVSINPREQEIFKCMIHNLFDEYRFFHKYPETELKVFRPTLHTVHSRSQLTLYSITTDCADNRHSIRAPDPAPAGRRE